MDKNDIVFLDRYLRKHAKELRIVGETIIDMKAEVEMLDIMKPDWRKEVMGDNPISAG